MPSHFTLRMQFGPHQDAEEVARQLLKLVRTAPVDEVMVFFFAEDLNNGHETLDEIKEWIERTRPWRKALADAGVTLSLNQWHTMLHGDRFRTLKPDQKWQPMVDPFGKAASACVCPLDPGWRMYYEETMRLYAKEGFRVIWIDDDIRFHNHLPLTWGGCFCPLHVSEFNQRAAAKGDAAGAKATREEIVAKCLAPGEPHPWRAMWLDMWQETHLEMIARWRDIAEAGGSKLGLMSSNPDVHAAEGRRWEDWWTAFGAKMGSGPFCLKDPQGARADDARRKTDLTPSSSAMHRPHFWGYNDALGSALPGYIAMLDQNRRVQTPGMESGPEIECHPYGRWNKSFRQTGAQMALAHILGSSNLNISLYDFMGNWPDDEPERADFLRQWRPALDWLADQFPMTLKAVGVGLPWSEDMGRKVRTDGSGQWGSLTCKTRGWANWLGSAGHAFAMAAQPAVNAIGGSVAWAFSDAELREWLAKGMLLDGVAASVLVERGLGELIGMKTGRFITQKDRLYSIEHCLDAAFSLRVGAQMGANWPEHIQRMYQGDLLSGARVVSDLRGPKQNVVGHGLTLFENGLGGCVAIVPWDAQSDLAMNIQRAAQLTKTLAWLSRGVSLGSASGAPWLVPQFLTDGRAWRGVVWNASPDAVGQFTITPPADTPPIRTATHIDARGHMRSATVSGDTVVVNEPMGQWEMVVV
jgi:hypothetical protein